MIQTILIGHSGFLGNALESSLKSDHRFLQPVCFSSKDADLTEQECVETISEKCNEDTVIVVCAAIKSDEGNSIDSFHANIMMSENLARLASAGKFRKFIYISSNAVYGVHAKHDLISEETPLLPDTYYSLSKVCTEKILQITLANSLEKLLILRPSTIYGPSERVLPQTPSGFLRRFLNDEPITLWGEGSELREFVFIADMVNIVKAMTISDFHGTMNVGGGIPHSYKDSLDIISNVVGKKVPFKSKPRTLDPVDKVYDLSLFNKLLPNFNFTSLKDGIRITYEKMIQGNCL